MSTTDSDDNNLCPLISDDSFRLWSEETGSHGMAGPYMWKVPMQSGNVGHALVFNFSAKKKTIVRKPYKFNLWLRT